MIDCGFLVARLLELVVNRSILILGLHDDIYVVGNLPIDLLVVVDRGKPLRYRRIDLLQKILLVHLFFDISV